MATPVAHSLTGLACLYGAMAYRKRLSNQPVWPTILLFILLANLPDFDLLAGLIFVGDPHAYHWGGTHSIFFAVVSSFFVMLILHKKFCPSLWLIYLAPILSHVIIDSFTGEKYGLIPTHGLPLYWPFSHEFVSMDATLFLGVHHADMDSFISLYNLKVVMYELMIFSPIIFFCIG